MIRALLHRKWWIAAWLCWGALGVGVYRVLPSLLSRPIARLPAEERDVYVHTIRFACRQDANTVLRRLDPRVVPGPNGRLEVWDFSTQELIRSLKLYPHAWIFDLPLDDAVVGFSIGDSLNPEYFVFQPSTGKRLMLPFSFRGEGFGDDERRWDVHPTQPLIALKGSFSSEPHWGKDGGRVAVWNYRTGELVGCLPPRNESVSKRKSYAFPRFWDNGRQLLVCATDSERGFSRAETWRLPLASGPERVFDGLPPSTFSSCGPWGDRVGVEEPTDVFDLGTGTYVFRDPPVSQPKPPDDRGYAVAVMSFDGRSIMDREEHCVRDVDSGEVLWRYSDDEGFLHGAGSWVQQRVPYAGIPFLKPLADVAKRCGFDWPGLKKAWALIRRDWRTGSELERRFPFGATEDVVECHDGTRAFDHSGNLYERPWRKPLGWWAAIMAIFALPLLAAHLVAWRRAAKRRVRETRRS